MSERAREIDKEELREKRWSVSKRVRERGNERFRGNGNRERDREEGREGVRVRKTLKECKRERYRETIVEKGREREIDTERGKEKVKARERTEGERKRE